MGSSTGVVPQTPMYTSSVAADGSSAPGSTATAPIYTQPSASTATAGTDLSGNATTTSGVFNLPANAARKPGDVQGQNVGTVNLGFNEFGGTAVIGAAGTFTVPPGATFSITTNRLVNFVCASGTCPVTITRNF